MPLCELEQFLCHGKQALFNFRSQLNIYILFIDAFYYNVPLHTEHIDLFPTFNLDLYNGTWFIIIQWIFIPLPQNVGGGAILDSHCRVGRSVGPSPILVRSITNGRISFKLE